MPRNGPATRRELAPDPVYRSVLVTQVVNKVLSRGKRTLAERIVYTALEQVQEKSGATPSPRSSARWRTRAPRSRSSRACSSVAPPTRCPSRRGLRRCDDAGHPLAHHLLAQRREKTMAERLAGEILDASNNIGASVKCREDMHKMAESNRALRPLPLVVERTPLRHG